ncbi:MAG: hypothetical protein RL094_469 [Candidatus Parcubacteria bacterium]|jgi:uncharacterized protein YacL
MDLAFYSLFLVSAAIGTGSSFIADVFFIFSFKNHQLRISELKMLLRLQFTAIIAASVALVSRLAYDAVRINSNIAIQSGVETALIFIFAIILVSSIILRKFHLPALLRHQQKYSHLSDSFKDHHDALIATAALGLISWLFIIFIAACEAQTFSISLHFLNVFLAYVIISFVGVQIALKIKGFYSIS